MPPVAKVKVLPIPKPIRPIKCVVKLFEANQYPKAHKQRKSTQLRTFSIDRDDEWDAIKLEMLKIIDSCLSPAKLDFSQYEVTYTIPRKVLDPVSFISEQDLTSLFSLTEPTKDCEVIVYICAKVSIIYLLSRMIELTSTQKSSHVADENASPSQKRKHGDNDGSESDYDADGEDDRKKKKKGKGKGKDKKPEPVSAFLYKCYISLTPV